MKPDIGRHGILFLPQRPFMALGSLRDQVTYPLIYRGESQKKVIDKEIVDILEMLSLRHVFDRVPEGLETCLVWEDVLSLGEQQRIAMARLFYHQPLVAILDECTSALD